MKWLRKTPRAQGWTVQGADADVPDWGPNEQTLRMVEELQPRLVAEIGVARGATSLALARALAADAELHLFDYEDVVEDVARRVREEGFAAVHAHGNSRRVLDSYNWSLMRLLRDRPELRFDYVFVDGAHTWVHDALAFLLVDRMLAPGGHVDFDDHDWSIATSPTMNPSAFPTSREWFSDEQIETCQVQLVIDLLVRDAGYDEVVPDKIFRKVR